MLVDTIGKLNSCSILFLLTNFGRLDEEQISVSCWTQFLAPFATVPGTKHIHSFITYKIQTICLFC
jgi:hypothetical protein